MSILKRDINTKSKLRITIFILSYSAFLLILVEFSSRMYLNIKENVPFFRPGEIIYNSYPELKTIVLRPINHVETNFNILLLGGSVLNNQWSEIEQLLRENLGRKLKKNIEIYNLSHPAHTSLDSLYKYGRLENSNFDLVVFYHGINEVRANNCPRYVFKDDYSHYSWYERVNLIERHKELNLISFPLTFALLFLDIKNEFYPSKYVPTHAPREEWLEYGSNIKTKKAFEKNLVNIIDISKKREEPLLLMTFAYYLPKNYNLERFERNSCTSTSRKCAVEIWGRPENVIKGIQIHNEVITDIIRRHNIKLFVDQESLITKDENHFNDICHLKTKGSQKFVNNILKAIIDNIKDPASYNRK